MPKKQDTLETRVTGKLFEDMSDCEHQFPAPVDGMTTCKECGMVLSAVMPGIHPPLVTANLYQRMNAVRSAVGKIVKDAEVTDRDGKVIYTAVKHDTVTSTIREALLTYGVMTTISLESSESVSQSVKWGAREVMQYRGTYAITFINADDSADQFTVRSEGYADDAGDKGPGKAESYAVKYCYLKHFLMVTGVDDEDRIPDDALSELTIGDIDKLAHGLHAEAVELFGDAQADDVLDALAKRRAHIESGDYREIPAKDYKLCLKSLQEKARQDALPGFSK